MPTNLNGLSVVTVLRLQEFDAAMVMLMVVLVAKLGYLLRGMGFGVEGLAGVIRPVFRCLEQRLCALVGIRLPWAGERSKHTHVFQVALQSGRTHGIDVIAIQDQRLLSPLAYPFFQVSPTYQIGCND